MHGTTIYLPCRIQLVKFDSLKNSFKQAQKKTIVKPNIATYWYNSMLCKF